MGFKSFLAIWTLVVLLRYLGKYIFVKFSFLLVFGDTFLIKCVSFCYEGEKYRDCLGFQMYCKFLIVAHCDTSVFHRAECRIGVDTNLVQLFIFPTDTKS